MKRILGIDYGTVRIGLALSDPLHIVASPRTTLLAEKTPQETVNAILAYIPATDLKEIVIGLPLLLSGKDSDVTEKVRFFAQLMEKTSALPIFLQDERLTSKEVERILRADGMKRKKRAKHLDALSATLILQTHLDRSKQPRVL